MKPDRTNYEIWLIDWLDGKLDEIQVRRLVSFLDENPDLKGEFYSCSDAKLSPPPEEFLYKRLLKKELSDITNSQFEYLCAGYVENDLSAEQLEELKKIVSDDIARKHEFELFQKTKLLAPNIKFSNKRKLLRATPFQKAFKISVATLATAASIAMFIVAYQFIGNNNLPTDNLSQLSVNNEQEPNIIVPETISDEAEKNIAFLAEQTAAVNILPANPIPEEIVTIEADVENAQDAIFILLQRDRLEPIEIPNLLSINLTKKGDYQSNILSSRTILDAPDPVEMRSLPINLAQLFRKKILKDENPDISPLRTYELAEAGIISLNRLLGWEMEFKKYKDESGEVKTIHFNSRLLGVNTPVNRSE